MGVNLQCATFGAWCAWISESLHPQHTPTHLSTHPLSSVFKKNGPQDGLFSAADSSSSSYSQKHNRCCERIVICFSQWILASDMPTAVVQRWKEATSPWSILLSLNYSLVQIYPPSLPPVSHLRFEAVYLDAQALRVFNPGKESCLLVSCILIGWRNVTRESDPTLPCHMLETL